mgnify:FL=1
MKKTKIIGILNLTQDSFSDGGKYLDTANALDHVKKMIADGVDVIDIGAESTKPGFQNVDSSQQLERILPVLKEIKEKYKSVLISIDTRSSLVAEETLNLGASIINDVSSGTYDPKMMEVIAKFNATAIFTHMPESHQTNTSNSYSLEILENIKCYFDERIKNATTCGLEEENIIVDPGICFGKTGKENIEIIKNIKFFVKNFKNICLGVSNKRFSSNLFKNFNDDELNIASLAVTTHCVVNDVSYLRVHDVSANKDALEVAWKTHTI